MNEKAKKKEFHEIDKEICKTKFIKKLELNQRDFNEDFNFNCNIS